MAILKTIFPKKISAAVYSGTIPPDMTTMDVITAQILSCSVPSGPKLSLVIQDIFMYNHVESGKGSQTDEQHDEYPLIN